MNIKVLKKILISLIVIVFLSQFVMPLFTNNNIVLAAGSNKAEPEKISGAAEVFLGALPGLISWIVRLFIIGSALAINTMVLLFANIGGTIQDGFFLSPYMVFFNKIPLVSVNIFDDNGISGLIADFRTGIATWYYVLRALATAILLIMLVYVGIRMAISSGVTDRVVYKKMLIDWVVSLAIIYLMHYFIVFVLYLNDSFVGILENLAGQDLNGENINQFITRLLEKATSFQLLGSGNGAVNNLMAFMCLLVYLILFFQTIKFLFIYVRRMMTVCFLILISPLISVTYSMDKMGDGKAQAFDMWLKEFLYNIFIQPFHCILYLAFANQAFSLVIGDWDNGSIAFSTTNGVGGAFGNGMLAILGILFINKGEEFIRNVFGFNKASSIESTAAAAVTVATMAKSAPQIAKGGKKMFTKGAQRLARSPLGKATGKLGASMAAGMRAGREEEKENKRLAAENGGNDLNSNKDKYESDLKKKGLMGAAFRAGRSVGHLTGKLSKEQEDKKNQKYALKRLNKKRKEQGKEQVTQEDIDNNDDLKLDFQEELIGVENEGGARAARNNDRIEKARKVSQNKNTKATGKPTLKQRFNDSKVGKAAHSAMETKFAKVASRTVRKGGHYVAKGANWAKEGAIISAKNFPKNMVVGTATLFSGIAAADATGDVLQTMTAAHTGYRSSKEMFTNTNITLRDERRRLMENLNLLNDESATDPMYEVEQAIKKDAILQRGRAGAYEEKVLSSAEKRIKEMLSKSSLFNGDERSVNDFINQMKLDTSSGKMTFTQALNKNLGGGQLSGDSEENDKMTEDVRDLMITNTEAKVYNNMKTAMDTGQSAEKVTGFTPDVAKLAVAGMIGNEVRHSRARRKEIRVSRRETGRENVEKAKDEIRQKGRDAAQDVKNKGEEEASNLRDKLRDQENENNDEEEK